MGWQVQKANHVMGPDGTVAGGRPRLHCGWSLWEQSQETLAHFYPLCPPGTVSLLSISLLSSRTTLKHPFRHIDGQTERVLFQTHLSPRVSIAATAAVSFFQPHDVESPWWLLWLPLNQWSVPILKGLCKSPPFSPTCPCPRADPPHLSWCLIIISEPVCLPVVSTLSLTFHNTLYYYQYFCSKTLHSSIPQVFIDFPSSRSSEKRPNLNSLAWNVHKPTQICSFGIISELHIVHHSYMVTTGPSQPAL